jgi:prolyl oligopeptidase
MEVRKYNLNLFLSVLYRQKTLNSEPEEFLDPNKMSTDGTVALSSYDFSEDYQIFSYMISEKGSDWNKIKVYLIIT